MITANGSNSPVTVRILDASGRIVEERINVAANGSLHIGNRYRAGIYLIEVIQGKEKVVLKMIKQSD